MTPKMSATSRDPEGYARRTEAARKQRAAAAHEVAQTIAEQVEQNIIEGDVMGGRAVLVKRIQQVAAAEQRGDKDVLRAALMDGAVAFGQWIASLDFVPPPDAVPPRGKAEASL